MAATSARELTLSRVVAALGAIALLAFVLPVTAVRAFHNRRLEHADRQLAAIAASLAEASSASIPAGTRVAAGSGPMPTVRDDGWVATSAFPLTRTRVDPGTDPWGNAFLVNLADPTNAWIVTAGPDGILQTRFSSPAVPAGDDRVAAVHR